MQSSIEQLDGLKQKLSVAMEWDSIDKNIEIKIKELSAKANVDGFRKGKVPRRIILQSYGASIQDEVKHKTMYETFQKVSEDKTIEYVGYPHFHIDQAGTEEGKTFAFTAEYEILPQFDVDECSGIKVTRIKPNIEDADVVDFLEALRKKQANWHNIERAVQENDKVIIDFEGYIDGEALEGGKAEDFELDLGAKSMIPGFEDGIVGMSADEEKEINLTFPEAYHNDKFSGKSATFRIKLKNIQAMTLPELDDAFAEKNGVKEGGFEKLKQDIRENMQEEADAQVRSQFNESVLDILLAKNQILLPSVLVQQEQEGLLKMDEEQSKGQPGAVMSELKLADYQERAEKRVKLSLIGRKLIEKHEIKPDAKIIDRFIKRELKAFGDLPQMWEFIRNNKEIMSRFENDALEEQLIEKIAEAMDVVDECKGFKSIMPLETQNNG